MRPFSLLRSLRIRLLPAILVPAALLAAAPFVKAQQAPPAAPADSASQVIPEAQDAPVTAEDIGDSLLIKRQYQEAIEQYRKMPNPSADLWNKMGIAYQMLFDPKDAARCYKQTLRHNPGHAYALNNMGTIYDAQGDYGKAEVFYRKALDANPGSARSAMNLGTNLMAQRKYSEGSEMYKRALALDPDVLDTSEGPISISGVPLEQRGAMNYYKAKDYAQVGMIDRAMRFLRKALNEGFASPTDIARDSSFSRLRETAAFKRLMAEHAKNPEPPQSSSNNSADESSAGDE